MPSTVFSVGIVRIGPVGVTLDDTHNIANVQTTSMTNSFQEALVNAGVSISQWATADAQFGAESGFTFSCKSFPHHLLKYTAGVTGVVAGGKTTYTPTHTNSPQYCQAEFIVTDTEGKKYRFNLPRAKTFQFNPQMTLTDHVGTDMAVMSRPGEPGLGYAPWKLEVDN